MKAIITMCMTFCITLGFATAHAQPDYGYAMTSDSSVRFYVNGAPWADIHYIIDDQGQQNFRMLTSSPDSHYFAVNGIPVGARVRYFFTIGNPAGGATDIPWDEFVMSGTSSSSSSSSSVSSSSTSSSSSSSTSSSSSISSSSISSSSSSINPNAIVPLYDGTNLQPDMVVDTGSAIITHVGDRARDRHAREPQFKRYEHYLPRYWEHRSSHIEIIDTVAKGGSTITVNVTSLHPLAQPDFRAFYLGQGVLTNYHYNQRMEQLDLYHYTATIVSNNRYSRPLEVGDLMEFEFSPFLSSEAPLIGRSNYYGTTLLYIVGTGGIVPWQGQGANLDSVVIPEEQRLGGTTTLPRNYSDEPMEAFKQTAGHMSHTNIQPFLLGRRLHHTDFSDGSHSEPGNPIMPEHVGQIGPHYVGRSCVACHLNNGGGLPPGTTGAEFDVQFFVDNSPRADVIYTINGVTQAFQMNSADDGRRTWTVHDIPGGASVQYRFTVDQYGGGQSVTDTYSFTMEGGSRAETDHLAHTVGHLSLSPALPYVFKVGADALGTPHPLLGKVLQPANTEDNPEADVSLTGWTTTPGVFADGTAYELRAPVFEFSGVQPTHFSAHMSPPLVGVGLLEALSESTITDLADPNDSDQNGISGRMALVSDPETGDVRLGRFGWKASAARLSHQVAQALVNDLGVTNAIFPEPDCGAAQTGCGQSGAEVGRADLDHWVKYVALLGLRPQRDLDQQGQHGEQLFTSAGCAGCHSPQLTTGPNHPFAELRNQTIRPYSDLLLHDMGPGLASTMGEGSASGAEWRTPPLWNLSYRAAVSGGEAYLHDGRARTLAEAILWHGGEAEASREAFRVMSQAERGALMAFLQSL